MHSAAAGGCVDALQALLALGADAAVSTTGALAPLHVACREGHVEAVRLLLAAAPRAAAMADSASWLPLHWAGYGRSTDVMRLLLAAGASGLGETTDSGETALHVAAACSTCEAVQVLLDAYPAAARMADGDGQLPLHLVLGGCDPPDGSHSLGVARLLPPASGLSADQLLDAVAAALTAPWGPTFRPLCADMAALQPLAAEQWPRVPAPCAGLGRALPAVLARSDAEASQLVRRLPAAGQQRLRAATLCLARRAAGAAAARQPGAVPGRLIACS